MSGFVIAAGHWTLVHSRNKAYALAQWTGCDVPSLMSEVCSSRDTVLNLRGQVARLFEGEMKDGEMGEKAGHGR